MARRNATQPITYTASYDPEPMTPETFARVQRNWARMLAQALVACPDLLAMVETEAGLIVPATTGIETPGDFLLPDTTPLVAVAQDFTEDELLLVCDAAARQGSGFRSAWMQWLVKQATGEKGFGMFTIPLPAPATAPANDSLLYRATHPHDRPYYRPCGEWFRRYAKQSEETFATLRRTA